MSFCSFTVEDKELHIKGQKKVPIPAAQHASYNKVKRTIRIYHECEGRIKKNPSRGSPFGIMRLAE